MSTPCMLVLMIGVSTYHVTRELPAPVQEELPSVDDLQEVVDGVLQKELPDVG